MNTVNRLRVELFKKIHFSLFGILGTSIILIVFLITAIIYRGSDGRTYNIFNHFVSELGFVGISEFAWLFNIGLIIGSILLSIFMVGLLDLFSTPLSKVACVLGFISAVFSALVGVFPMNYIIPHAIVALLYFFCGLVTIFLFSIVILKEKSNRFPKFFAWFGFFIFFSTLVFLFFPFNEPGFSTSQLSSDEWIGNVDAIRPDIWGAALLEWVSVLGMTLWLLFFSSYLKIKHVDSSKITQNTSEG